MHAPVAWLGKNLSQHSACVSKVYAFPVVIFEGSLSQCPLSHPDQTGKKGKLLKLVGLDVGGEGRAWMQAPESWPE